MIQKILLFVLNKITNFFLKNNLDEIKNKKI
jgi:hypothetical protein